MINSCQIKVGKFEGFSWIRCEGKGSFLNSSAVKEYGDSRIKCGETCLVVDLQDCQGMDSTFMGTLAGLANRLNEAGGCLQIASASEKSSKSLEDLGLDYFMDINPDEAAWLEVTEQARDLLIEKVAGVKAGTVLHSRHILEAHEILSEANDANRSKFSGVIGVLEAELSRKLDSSC